MRFDKFKHKKVAAERVERLFDLAKENFKEDPKLANRYVALARKMAMKYKLSLPSSLKRRFCKHCGSYWLPGVTVMVRTQRGKVVYSCKVCKKVSRIGYQREKKARRSK